MVVIPLLGGAPRLEDIEASQQAQGRQQRGGLPDRADEGGTAPAWPGTPGPRLSACLSPGAAVVRSPSRLPKVHRAEVQGWFGPGFLAPLLHVSGVVLEANLVWRESQGGRKYPTHLPDYTGPVAVGEKRWRSERRPGGILLSSISRDHRKDFEAAPGSLFLDVDIDQCFPSILAALSGDERLAAGCQDDLHRVSGDLLVPALPAARRRSVGKLFNLSALGGITEQGWSRYLREAGVKATRSQAKGMLDTWWAGFPAARDFRDGWGEMHRETAAQGGALWVTLPDERGYQFRSSAVLGQTKGGYVVREGTPQGLLEGAVRTTLSSVFRGVESVILDRALQLIYPLREEGLRLVLPMYDGVLLQVPVETAPTLARAVQAAFVQVLAEVGVPATVSAQLRPTWG